MNHLPTVAVIVPNFNHADYLAVRLDSIFSQTISPDRVLILDDCSTDGSETIIEGYLGRENVEYVPNESNTGDLFKQWNKGIESVNEDYIWIAESDDFSEPTFLKNMLDLALRYPSAGIVYCKSDHVDEDGKWLGDIDEHYAGLFESKRWNSGFFNSGFEECRTYMLQRNTIPNASACLFKRETLIRIGLASTGFRLCGDWMTYVRILEVSDIAYCSETLNHYRLHPQTVRSSSQRTLIEIFETYRVLNYIKVHFEFNNMQLAEAAARTFERFHYLLSKSSMNELKSWREILVEASKFDPFFIRRLSSPQSSMLEMSVVYMGENGIFSEERKLIERYPGGMEKELHFKACFGRLRFDPICRVGSVVLSMFQVTDSSTGEMLWSASEENSFDGIRVAVTAIRLTTGDDFLVYAYGADPWVFLDGWTGSEYFVENRRVDLEVRLKVFSMEE